MILSEWLTVIIAPTSLLGAIGIGIAGGVIGFIVYNVCEEYLG